GVIRQAAPALLTEHAVARTLRELPGVAMAAVPAAEAGIEDDTTPLGPSFDAGADGIDPPGHVAARDVRQDHGPDARTLEPGTDEEVHAIQAYGGDAQATLARSWLRHRGILELGPAWP